MSIFDLFRRTAPPEEVPTSIPRVVRGAGVRRRSGYAAAASPAYQGDFRASAGSADYELSIALPRVRNKTRALARNSGTMKRYIQLLKDNVVGEEGFGLQVRVRRGDGKPDSGLNAVVETAWSEFCEAPTVDGEMDIIELEKQMVATWGRDGEFIIEYVMGPSKGDDGIRFNPIEGDLLDEGLNTIYPPTGNEIRMGVEVNADRKPVAYHFLTQHPGDMSWNSPMNNQRYRRVPAERVLHVFERLRAGQTRGEPPASSIPGTVKMLDGYREAEVTGRRVKSSTMGLITEDHTAGSGPGDGLDGMADREGGDTHEDFEMDLEPGTFKKLPRGLDLKTFDPGGAQTDYAQFEGQVKTDVSMGVSISPVSLGYETAKLSYSTHRGIVAEDRDMYRGLQSFFIRMGMRKMFLKWFDAHVAFNVESKVPPTRVRAVKAKFKFLGRGWVQIDPTKDTKAENEQLAARTTSLSRIAAKRGTTRDALLDEIEDDERALKDRGLTQTLGNGNTAQTTSGGDTNEDDGSAET